MKKFIPGDYYEAKLQVRPNDAKLLEFINSEIKKANVEIVDRNNLKEGIDLYINSADFAIKMGKKFRNKYDIKPKVSRSLTGENKQLGKRIYKITVLLKIN
jgi:NMD protein affecting ribosome stability and mRNA decay